MDGLNAVGASDIIFTPLMNLLLIRHAPAGDKIAFAKTGRPDRIRPLAEAGRRKMKKAARGLRTIAPSLDFIAASPWRRAQETAFIVAKACRCKRKRLLTIPELIPGTPHDALLARLKSLPESITIALVGHEPHLSGLAGWLLGAKDAGLAMKKGGTCLILFDGHPKAGAGRLAWFMPPKLLRRLARNS